MSTWAYYWPDKTLSIVTAKTKEEALFLLDEVGSASSLSRLVPVDAGVICTLEMVKEESEDPEGYEYLALTERDGLGENLESMVKLESSKDMWADVQT